MKITLNPKDEARFWRNVKKQGEHDCWLWEGSCCSGGYGMVMVNCKSVATHRLSFQMAFHKLHKKDFVCHSCDVKNCVNPAHLWVGNQKANMADMAQKGRSNKGKKYGKNPNPERWPRGENHWSHIRPDLRNKGETHGKAKFKNEDIQKIRLLAKSQTHREIAAAFGVGKTAISQIINRKTWGHVV